VWGIAPRASKNVAILYIPNKLHEAKVGWKNASWAGIKSVGGPERKGYRENGGGPPLCKREPKRQEYD
jgi:hypothetical protein